MITKNELIEYRNAVYFGQTLITASNHQLRNGIGLMVSDTGALVFAYWSHNLIDGKYFYSNGASTCYGHMKAGQYEGWNVLNEGDLTVWC